MARHLKGQTASEYVILLAVTLMVGLAATALLTWAPGVGKDARLRESEAYWRSAQPFAIVGAQAAGNGTLSLKVQNNAAESLVLKSLSLGGTSYAVSSTYIGPGSSATLSIPANLSSGSGVYEGAVTFTYDTASFTNLVQSGGSNFITVVPASVNASNGTASCLYNETQSGCSSASECCASNNICGSSGKCCRPTGTNCTAGSQCCSGTCTSGTCRCATSSKSCQSVSECCQSPIAQSCDASVDKCCYPLHTDEVTSGTVYCCPPGVGACSSGDCEGTTCCLPGTATGTASCTSDADCCYWSALTVSICNTNTSTCCNTVSHYCTSNSQCCSGQCYLGTNRCCNPAGQTCEGTSQNCCSGSCNFGSGLCN